MLQSLCAFPKCHGALPCRRSRRGAGGVQPRRALSAQEPQYADADHALLGIIVAEILGQHERTGKHLVWIWLCATPVFSNWMCLSLEGGYPPVAVESLPSADAIVVLGGAMESARPPDLYPNLGAAADRVWHAARVYHAGKAPLIIASGGRLPWSAGPQPEADAMVQFLGDLGVPQDKILAERNSQTTFGNAHWTKQLLAANGIAEVLLVTSALHMRRAEATFRAAGIRVIAAPTDYESVPAPRWTALDYLPDAAALALSSRAL